MVILLWMELCRQTLFGIPFFQPDPLVAGRANRMRVCRKRCILIFIKAITNNDKRNMCISFGRRRITPKPNRKHRSNNNNKTINSFQSTHSKLYHASNGADLCYQNLVTTSQHTHTVVVWLWLRDDDDAPTRESHRRPKMPGKWAIYLRFTFLTRRQIRKSTASVLWQAVACGLRSRSVSLCARAMVCV